MSASICMRGALYMLFQKSNLDDCSLREKPRSALEMEIPADWNEFMFSRWHSSTRKRRHVLVRVSDNQQERAQER